MAIDESKLNEFLGKFVGDLGAVMHAATVVVGDTLGLYKALAEKPATAEQLAKRTERSPAAAHVGHVVHSDRAPGFPQHRFRTRSRHTTRQSPRHHHRIATEMAGALAAPQDWGVRKYDGGW
jgi:hypothetical protein